MSKILALSLLTLASATFVFAGSVTAPEIDAASGVGALTLLSGAVLVLRSRRRKQ
jgi:MYXO-CTERM domain-containing protein